jgi:hypothetical protein
MGRNLLQVLAVVKHHFHTDVVGSRDAQAAFIDGCS